MQPTDVIVTNEPERDLGATTGDAQPRTEITVGWPGVPSEIDLRAFEQQYPPHLYDTCHWHNYPSDDV